MIGPRRPVARFIALITLAVIAAACGGGADEDDSRLDVVASTTILAHFVEQVGGDEVTVQALVPAGADAHTFSLTPGAVRDIARADLVVIAGSGLGAVEDDMMRNARGRVLVLTEGMPLKPFPPGLVHGDGNDPGDTDDDDHDHGAVDPHFWMDIDLVATAVEAIRDALVALDPERADIYTGNAAAFAADLEALDAEIREMLAGLPEQRRYLVTFHDAYGYFADRYGLTILGFVVEGPEEEPSAATIAALVREMRERDIGYVFTEPQFSSRVVEQLARDTGAVVRTIPSGSLSDEYPTYREFMLAIARGIAE
ncbi:MAG: metal ABC transporter substrate-binding protein [Dehalococcoidia bacterium]